MGGTNTTDLRTLDPTRLSRADLHVHSKYSDRPSDWFLRRIGSPESFVEPREIYRIARARGMDFVTISDHNCIDGALEIAAQPGTFLSNEATVYFPESGAKVHILTTGITEEQFRCIQEVRENIYDFRAYVVEQDVVCSVAHPFFRVNDRLTVAEVEKLLLLFNRFEGINGTRDRRACELAHRIFSAVTPAQIAAWADKHDVEPLGPTPWVKTFTGGSDDHSGLYIAKAHTITPRAETPAEFLQLLRAGQHQMAGNHGTSVLLAHCFYHIGYSYYKDRLLGAGKSNNLLAALFSKLLEQPKPKMRPGLLGWFKGLVERFVRARRLRQMSDTERMLVKEFTELFRQVDAQEAGAAQAGNGHGSNGHDKNGSGKNAAAAGGNGVGQLASPAPAPRPRDSSSAPTALSDERTFHIACHICHLLSYSFLSKLPKYVREGRLIDSIQTFASLGPVAMSMAPYLVSFRTQHKDESFLRQVAEHFPAARDARLKSPRKAWLTDTFHDLNGVARTIQTLAGEARNRGLPLTVLTSLDPEPASHGADVCNFPPIGTFALPEYEQQRVALPPFLEVVRRIESEDFGELILSTPGPMGLIGLAAAKLLGLKTVGIYHTDFPAYAQHLTQDVLMEQLARRYMLWFYDQMDAVFVPGPTYRQHLIDLGIDPGKLLILKRGVDLDLFAPTKRQPSSWAQFGLGDGFKFLYVGRISKEKNLDALFAAFERLQDRQLAADLVVVGDGPYLEELQCRRQQRITFTGRLTGEDLARAYASADAFVFPSITDTFGNVVLEAQACGLPVVVASGGGSADILQEPNSGLAVNVADAAELAWVMERLLHDRELRQRLGAASLRNARNHPWGPILQQLWSERAAEPAPDSPPRSRLHVSATTRD